MARLVPRTIVVGVDGGAGSAHVLDAAFALAETVAARVIVAHVVAAGEAGRLDAAELAGLAEASRSRVGARLPSDEVVLPAADAASGLVALAWREGADLIVVGRGRSDDGPLSLAAPDDEPTERHVGGCTLRVLATASCPVLAVYGVEALSASPCWRYRAQVVSARSW